MARLASLEAKTDSLVVEVSSLRKDFNEEISSLRRDLNEQISIVVQSMIMLDKKFDSVFSSKKNTQRNEEQAFEETKEEEGTEEINEERIEEIREEAIEETLGEREDDKVGVSSNKIEETIASVLRDLGHDADKEGDKTSEQRIVPFNEAASQHPIKCVDGKSRFFCALSEIVDSVPSQEDKVRFQSWYNIDIIHKKGWGPAKDAHFIKPSFDFKVEIVDSKNWFQTLWTPAFWLSDSVSSAIFFFFLNFMQGFFFLDEI